MEDDWNVSSILFISTVFVFALLGCWKFFDLMFDRTDATLESQTKIISSINQGEVSIKVKEGKVESFTKTLNEFENVKYSIKKVGENSFQVDIEFGKKFAN